MKDLTTIRCIACEGGVPPLTTTEIKELLPQLKHWEVSQDGKSIRKRFTFKGFYKTMAFVNAVAWIANQENHHPDMLVGYNYCEIHYMTHAINGLSKNDFICAAKVDALSALD